MLSPKMGFPGGSDGKESACSARDQGSITGLGRSAGEGNGYSSILPGEFHGQRVLWATVRGVTRSHHLLYSSKSNFANSPKNVLMYFVEASFPSFLFFHCRIQSQIIYCIILVAMSQIFKNRNLSMALAY